MQGLVGRFGKQLEGFKTTRQLLRSTTGTQVQAPEGGVSDDRREVLWQHTLATELLEFGRAVADALKSLERAHLKLLAAGVAEAGVDPAALQAAARQLARAHGLAFGCAFAAAPGLESQLRAIAACEQRLQQAEEANAELRHYEDKVESLKQEKAEALRNARSLGNEKYAAVREHDALKRNEGKLKQAVQDASTAQAAAQRAVQEVRSQRDGLCRVAQDVVAETTRALACVGPNAAVGAEDGSPDPDLARAEAAEPAEGVPSSYAACLLGSPELLRALCRMYFRHFDANGNGRLDLNEVAELAEELHEELGVPTPDPETLRASVAAFAGAEPDGALTQETFPGWFAAFLADSLADPNTNRDLAASPGGAAPLAAPSTS